MTGFPKLSYVCPIRWDELEGGDREKFCSKCGHRVSNLSLMSAAERESLLAKASGERLCVSFYLRLSGEYVTPEAPLTESERSKLKQVGVALLSAGALALAAGCTSAPLPVAKPATTDLFSPDESVVTLHAFGMLLPSPK